MRVRGLQHVSSPFATGGQPALRAFYAELLGLRELPIPTTLVAMDLVWFAAGDGLELHFFNGETDPAAARHFCLEVDDLAETRRRLVNAGHEPSDDTPIPNRPRFFCRDPAGNRVEFTTILNAKDS
jgi:catechol 2,3-dioxygenase-like lactoylglutathione lyase family enzyme